MQGQGDRVTNLRLVDGAAGTSARTGSAPRPSSRTRSTRRRRAFGKVAKQRSGRYQASYLGENALQWILGISFVAMAVWMLIPDKLDDEDVGSHSKWGVFGTTVVAFFLAEMGDKTQIATVMLAAKYVGSYFWVVAGTTFGMMLANAPVVWLGDKIVKKVPIRTVHMISAVIFLVLGLLALYNPVKQLLA